MKVFILAVGLSLFVASQAFILNDGFRDLAMFNVVQGRSPFDFSMLFGGGMAGAAAVAGGAPTAGATGAQATAGASNAAVTTQYQTQNPLSNLFGLSLVGDMGFF